MKWLIDFLTSSLGRKLLMSLTGIFLILFLLIHLLGNLQLLRNDGGAAFNAYANFMSTNPLIQFVSKMNFLIIIGHSVLALVLTIRNRKARGGDSYVVPDTKASTWASRNMGILGTIVLVFVIVHLKDFYGQVHYGTVAVVEQDGQAVKNLYGLVAHWFSVEWYVALYVVCMGAVGFHLWHGFISAFQTLGLNHVKYNGLIQFVGKAFAVVVPALYALIPIYMYLM